MLKLANVQRTDVVYDLGCGDGRIVIAAAREFGARGVGIDIDPDRIREAVANARAAGVATASGSSRAISSRPISARPPWLPCSSSGTTTASCPRLWDQLRPGTPVVSHEHDFGADWPPAQQITTNGKTVYLYVVPERK